MGPIGLVKALVSMGFGLTRWKLLPAAVVSTGEFSALVSGSRRYFFAFFSLPLLLLLFCGVGDAATDADTALNGPGADDGWPLPYFGSHGNFFLDSEPAPEVGSTWRLRW